MKYSKVSNIYIDKDRLKDKICQNCNYLKITKNKDKSLNIYCTYNINNERVELDYNCNNFSNK